MGFQECLLVERRDYYLLVGPFGEADSNIIGQVFNVVGQCLVDRGGGQVNSVDRVRSTL